jgi:flagellar biosynthesis protein FliR
MIAPQIKLFIAALPAYLAYSQPMLASGIIEILREFISHWNHNKNEA